jgi:hypothetical protein
MHEGNAIQCKHEVHCKHNLVAIGEGIVDIGKMVDNVSYISSLGYITTLAVSRLYNVG